MFYSERVGGLCVRGHMAVIRRAYSGEWSVTMLNVANTGLCLVQLTHALNRPYTMNYDTGCRPTLDRFGTKAFRIHRVIPFHRGRPCGKHRADAACIPALLAPATHNRRTLFIMFVAVDTWFSLGNVISSQSSGD